jgi:hypothetical protein
MLHYNPQLRPTARKVKNRRRQMQNGHRLAALRALTAATLCREKNWSVAMAATSCGSNIVYVEALLTVLRSENTTLLQRVLKGEVSIVAAARAMKRIARLVSAFRGTTAAEHAVFGRIVVIVGAGTVSDTMVVPAL